MEVMMSLSVCEKQYLPFDVLKTIINTQYKDNFLVNDYIINKIIQHNPSAQHLFFHGFDEDWFENNKTYVYKICFLYHKFIHIYKELIKKLESYNILEKLYTYTPQTIFEEESLKIPLDKIYDLEDCNHILQLLNTILDLLIHNKITISHSRNMYNTVNTKLIISQIYYSLSLLNNIFLSLQLILYNTLYNLDTMMLLLPHLYYNPHTIFINDKENKKIDLQNIENLHQFNII